VHAKLFSLHLYQCETDKIDGLTHVHTGNSTGVSYHGAMEIQEIVSQDYYWNANMVKSNNLARTQGSPSADRPNKICKPRSETTQAKK